MEGDQETSVFTLVARKPSFGLPTACPNCLPAFIYLKLAQVPFELAFNSTFPDSDELPYFESGTYVAYYNEDDGVIEKLKKNAIVNLDSQLQSLPEYLSLKALVVSWLGEALTYELWVGTEGISSSQIYYSDLPWVISKVLFYKQTYMAKKRLEISKENAEQREKQIYKRAGEAYEALSTRLGEQKFLFEDRPSSLDAIFLSHILFTIQALAETSVLRCNFWNIVILSNMLRNLSQSSSKPRLHLLHLHFTHSLRCSQERVQNQRAKQR